MIRTIAVVSVAVTALIAAMQWSGQLAGSHRASPPAPAAAPAQAAAARATVAVTPAAPARGRIISHREQMARLVAETAAITAERTTLRVLAEKSGIQQTASR